MFISILFVAKCEVIYVVKSIFSRRIIFLSRFVCVRILFWWLMWCSCEGHIPFQRLFLIISVFFLRKFFVTLKYRQIITLWSIYWHKYSQFITLIFVFNVYCSVRSCFRTKNIVRLYLLGWIAWKDRIN